jgi:hypothetical protein
MAGCKARSAGSLGTSNIFFLLTTHNRDRASISFKILLLRCEILFIVVTISVCGLERRRSLT